MFLNQVMIQKVSYALRNACLMSRVRLQYHSLVVSMIHVSYYFLHPKISNEEKNIVSGDLNGSELPLLKRWENG